MNIPARGVARFVKLFVAWVIIVNSSLGALKWETQQIQQTANADDRKAVANFRFTNAGSVPVTITSVKSTCGCTAAKLDKRTFGPGQGGEIKAIFTFEGRVGLHEKTIEVMTDDPSANPVSLVLRVTIQESLTCSSRLLLWRLGETMGEKTVTVSPIQPNKIVSMETNPAMPLDIKVKAEPTDAGKYKLLITPTSDSKTINVAIDCVATFANGTKHPFKIFALVR